MSAAHYLESAPYPVGREKIREFATAVGASDTLHTDVDTARRLGYPDVVAPPTFPIVLTYPADHRALSDPDLALDLGYVVLLGQEFTQHRPVVAGDVLRVRTELAGHRRLVSRVELITSHRVLAEDGSPVTDVRTTILSRPREGAAVRE
ncbi:MAG: MaoC family dehydratase N-terminal domain-containing protein [Actinocatenispora sp.]